MARYLDGMTRELKGVVRDLDNVARDLGGRGTVGMFCRGRQNIAHFFDLFDLLVIGVVAYSLW